MQDGDEMCRLVGAIMKMLYGTDAETEHPKTQQDVQDKFGEALQSIDQMRESSDRLARFQPAKSLDEALRQIVGSDR